jgi:transcriptional regulator with XRE-family HTH domain
MTNVHLDDAQAIGRLVRSRRLALDMTKSEAARRASVSRRTWHEIEEGQRSTTTAETLVLFDQVLGLEEGFLLAMTAKGRNAEVEQLRRRLAELARHMTSDELRQLVERAEGRRTATLDEVRRDINEVREAVRRLSEQSSGRRAPTPNG